MLKNFKTFKLAKDLYQKCTLLKLPHYLKEQLLRASSSVALNLAEGSGKETKKDKRKFYFIAMGSLREVSAILELAQINNPEVSELLDKTTAHLYKLIKYYE